MLSNQTGSSSNIAAIVFAIDPPVTPDIHSRQPITVGCMFVKFLVLLAT